MGLGQSDKPECRGRGVPAAASPPTESLLQYSPALRRVTTGFGMGPGGATALSATGTPRPPHSCSVRRRSHASHGRRVRPGVVSCVVFVKRLRPNRSLIARDSSGRCRSGGVPPGERSPNPVTIGDDRTEVPSLIRTGRLRSVTSRPPPAYQPGRLPGSLPLK